MTKKFVSLIGLQLKLSICVLGCFGQFSLAGLFLNPIMIPLFSVFFALGPFACLLSILGWDEPLNLHADGLLWWVNMLKKLHAIVSRSDWYYLEMSPDFAVIQQIALLMMLVFLLISVQKLSIREV